MSNNKRTIAAANFVGTIEANVDNPKLSDAEFRAFIRKTLPIVIHSPSGTLINCQTCRKLGDTTCGNDTKNLSCYEGG